MTQQEQRQFTDTMQMIVPQVIDRMVKEYGMIILIITKLLQVS